MNPSAPGQMLTAERAVGSSLGQLELIDMVVSGGTTAIPGTSPAPKKHGKDGEHQDKNNGKENFCTHPSPAHEEQIPLKSIWWSETL